MRLAKSLVLFVKDSFKKLRCIGYKATKALLEKVILASGVGFGILFLCFLFGYQALDSRHYPKATLSSSSSPLIYMGLGSGLLSLTLLASYGLVNDD